MHMVLAIIALVIGFAGGFYAGVKNANSQKVEKAKGIIDSIQNK